MYSWSSFLPEIKYFRPTESLISVFSTEWPKSNDLNHQKRLIPLYRRISVLSNIFTAAVSSLLFPSTKFNTLLLIIADLFGTIRFRNDLGNLSFISLPMGAFVFLLELVLASTFMARLYHYSSELSRNWTHKNVGTPLERRIFRKALQASRPIRFEVRKFYFFRERTMLNTVLLVLDLTINLLLAT